MSSLFKHLFDDFFNDFQRFNRFRERGNEMEVKAWLPN